MDLKNALQGLFLLKEFAPVMGIAVLVSLLWWGVDPGLLWHDEMSPFEAFVRSYMLLDGGWAQFGRWGAGFFVCFFGFALIVPLGLIGFGVLSLVIVGVSLAFAVGVYALAIPPIGIFVFWMFIYDAFLTYVLKRKGVKEYDDLSRNNWVSLIVLTVLTYGVIGYWLMVRFVP